MGLFLDAAIKWDQLSDTSYDITIGHRHVSKTLHIVFRPIDFDHLSGIHYAKDIDFGLHRREYRGKKLVQALISQKLEDTRIEKSVNWSKISERLSSIMVIEEILDSNCSVYQFNPRKLPFHSTITAAYFLYSELKQEGIFLFVDQEEALCYCKSIFKEHGNDYRRNQTRWTVLKKSKRVKDTKTTLFIHPSFQEKSP